MTSPLSSPNAESKPTGPRRRRRWLPIAAGVLATLVAVAGLGIGALQLGLPWQLGEGDRNHVYEGDAGSQRYQVHLPPRYDETVRLPVVMAIHGCGMTGYGWNSMKATTQFNRLADREGFIVVYPTQLISRNVIACWNSADPRHQQRRAGEPALLAGVARQVVEKYHADPAQVHVAGASSGAGTAVILAATYPDVFATATSVAGGEYGLNQVDPDNPDATPPLETARQAWAQMGERARRVPLLVVQGEQDDVVPTLVATRLVAQWTAVGDLVDDGLPNDSLGLTEKTVSVPAAAGRHAYAHSTVTAADGSSIVESYVVQDMGHAWPGPDGDGRYTDHAGPDATALVWEFAKRHPMPQ
ncbi:extracellular catalytic domain type 1 short-chain-length polyhydroxyalkanoate depolymerase [Micromonospora radicis]|uniref:Esterase n=1 Tax=Micromonospora radicis TaxID=1894971 RepID=A0A418MYT9_9ACTN|nr:PHB depolymerase family esterase [Micromonospora radicis]RIV40348.1 hypothetical protein D2L64_05810 [Micromonospora radicis]